MKSRIIKYTLLSSASLILLACGNDEETGTEEDATEEVELEEPSEGTEENSDEVDSDHSDENELDESENSEDEEESTDETVEEETVDEEESPQNEEISGVVHMSEEERRSHHEGLAVRPQDLPDDAYDYLMLPGLHENTAIYEGRIAPGKTLEIIFPDDEELANRTEITPEVSEEGYFLVELDEFHFEAGQEVRFGIRDGENATQVFDVPVYESEEGMEEIRVIEEQ